MSLRDDLLRERLAAYSRLRGGFPIPMAGVVYWAALGIAGYSLRPNRWTLLAFVFSGSIFPLALLFAKLFRIDFMRDKTAVSDLLGPAFATMLLFWPMAIAGWWTDVQLVPLILAIGMSLHWPAIGWMYGKPWLYTAHAVVRAVACFLIWWKLPEGRFTLLPFSVALVYLVTVVAIFIDSGRSAALDSAPHAR